MRITLPNVLALDEARVKNRIRQIAERSPRSEGELRNFTRDRLEGFLFRSTDGLETVIIPKARPIPAGLLRVVEGAAALDAESLDLRDGRWLKHPILTAGAGRPFDYPGQFQAVPDSWINAFSYVMEDSVRGVKALRGPQIGAVHAVHAHWTVSDAPATIVMPTGTGKTETMLSVLVSARCARV